MILSSGGLLQGIVGSDEAFALTLAVGIAVIYGGFVVASNVSRASVAGAPDAELPADERQLADLQEDAVQEGDAAPSSRRSNLPANERGSSSTSSTRVGSL